MSDRRALARKSQVIPPPKKLDVACFWDDSQVCPILNRVKILTQHAERTDDSFMSPQIHVQGTYNMFAMLSTFCALCPHKPKLT